MRSHIKKPEQLARIATLCTLSFMICWGAAMVVAEIRPFWIDEWRVIYNLKFRNAGMLWGQLDFLQQFPRVYLELIKVFTSLFDYSYFSLRIPSFIVGTGMIFLCYQLMNKIYAKDHVNRFLFIMILVSASTFTDYYVQIKQYTMDLLLALVALWQFMELLKLTGKEKINTRSYLLLCASFAIVPFFSYTYPIAVAPVFIIQIVRTVWMPGNTGARQTKAKILPGQLFPLFLCAVSNSVFYFVDVSQLMGDKGMHKFWGHLMMRNGFNGSTFFYGFYNLFAEIGSGMMYWCVFGVLGIISFLWSIYYILVNLRSNHKKQTDLILLYSVLLLLLAIVLFIVGKLPLGEPRLNAFMIPAISIIMIRFIDQLHQEPAGKGIANALSVLLYVGVVGNVYTTFYASYSGTDYDKKMAIYRSTNEAIKLAESKKIPMVVTPDIAWPYEKTQNLPFSNTVPGDWVLKTFPAYHVDEHMPVYSILSLATIHEGMKQIPNDVKVVLAGAGETFHLVTR